MGESKEQLDLKTQVDEVAGKINAYLRELEEIGCEFKDFDKDWSTSTAASGRGDGGGREILWCWQFGEDRIAAWHELDAGFAGRQPLPRC